MLTRRGMPEIVARMRIERVRYLALLMATILLAWAVLPGEASAHGAPHVEACADCVHDAADANDRTQPCHHGGQCVAAALPSPAQAASRADTARTLPQHGSGRWEASTEPGLDLPPPRT